MLKSFPKPPKAKLLFLMAKQSTRHSDFVKHTKIFHNVPWNLLHYAKNKFSKFDLLKTNLFWEIIAGNKSRGGHFFWGTGIFIYCCCTIHFVHYLLSTFFEEGRIGYGLLGMHFEGRTVYDFFSTYFVVGTEIKELVLLFNVVINVVVN